jgi:glycosyltransferase involved in cell wall biosynthesis
MLSPFKDTKKLPLVTIVTPTFNQAEFLEETILSVLSQDYRELEYIVINDGSTDETSKILERYKDRLVVIHQANLGQSATLNKGWKLASGKLIGYISSDDLLQPNAVSVLVQALMASEEAVLAYPNYEVINKVGTRIGTVTVEEFDFERHTVDLICTIGPGALFIREAFEKAGGWDFRFRQVPDIDFWFRLIKFGKFIKVDQILASSRLHEASATYRRMSFRRSVEIVVSVKKLWNGVDDPVRRQKALGKAHLVSGRNNLQSGRVKVGLSFITSAALIEPSLLLTRSFWYTLVQGFRTNLYKLLGRI